MYWAQPDVNFIICKNFILFFFIFYFYIQYSDGVNFVIRHSYFFFFHCISGSLYILKYTVPLPRFIFAGQWHQKVQRNRNQKKTV